MALIEYSLAKCGKSITIEERTTRLINGLPKVDFSNPLPFTAIIRTVKGVRVFDDTNTETDITHRIVIKYDPSVTSEKWVRYNGKLIRIVSVENCAESNKVLILLCTMRGLDGVNVNKG